MYYCAIVKCIISFHNLNEKSLSFCFKSSFTDNIEILLCDIFYFKK